MDNVQIFMIIYLFVLAPLIFIMLMSWKYLNDKPHLQFMLTVPFFASCSVCFIPYFVIYCFYTEISGAIKEIRS
jgi:hypothetical protein